MKAFRLTTLVATSLLLVATPVHAQRSSVQEIRIARGNVCYDYVGSARRWAGNFQRGQTISVTIISGGRFSEGEDRPTDRLATVRGPNGFSQTQREIGWGEKLTFTAPASGRYTFSFTPTSLHYGQVNFDVCAT